MKVKIFKSIDDIDSGLWDSLLSEDEILKSYNFLKATEHSCLSECNFWYLLFYDGDILAAHAAFFTIYSNIEEASSTGVKNLFNKIREVFPGFMRVKYLGCGTPVATCSNVISISAPYYREEVLSLMVRNAKEIASIEKANAILFRDFSKEEAEVLNAMTDSGFLRISTLPTSFVDVKWKSFEEYMGSFKKKYRYNMKKNISKLDENDIYIEVCSEFEQYAEDICKLYANVYDKANTKFEKLNPSFFANISKYLAGRSQVLLFRRKDEIIGFELIVEDKNILRPLYLGIDYRFNENCGLYFNLIYRILGFGIERGKKLVELGQTTYYPKLSVGARVEPLYMYIRFINPILHALLRKPLSYLFPERVFAPKDVFKDK